MNVGTIVETDTIKVRLKGGGVLGEIEDYFVQGLSIGDSFIFAGRVLEFAGMKANQVLARPGQAKEPKVPAYAGGRLPLSPGLAQTVRQLLNDPQTRSIYPQWFRNGYPFRHGCQNCPLKSGC